MTKQTFDTPITTNDQSIERVLNAELPIVLVATHGALKRRVQNSLHKIAREEAGKVLIVKLKLDENPEAAARLKLDGGGVISFKDGAEVSRSNGAPTAAIVKEHVTFLLGGTTAPGASASSGGADGKPFAVSDASFERDVLKSTVPVLVDFWAPWCGPCRMIAPVVEKLAEDYVGQLRVAKVNTDENPRWATQYGIRGIPSLLLIKGGEVVERLVGVQPEPVLRAAVERALLI